MIGWEETYKVIEAMVPLYFALILGYGSVKWWSIFTPDQCDAVNRLVCYFTLPLFVFGFTAHIDPFKMNYKFIAADIISKVIIVTVIGIWVKFSSKGSYCWSITSFSLSTLTNSLVVGVPLVKAMYGQPAVDLVVQSSVIQAIIWLTLLLFVLELHKSMTDHIIPTTNSITPPTTTQDETHQHHGQCKGGGEVVENMRRPSFRSVMKVASLKLAVNPNSHACVIGIVWAFLANRCNLEMPNVILKCVQIMSNAGTGTAMFSMGMFMALQEKIIACGPSLTLFGILLKFFAGPAAMAIGSIAMGLHGNVLRVAIIQAALPQSITSFIFAKEYGVHADVLSTAVIFGMMVSLPILIGFYAALELLH